MNTFDCDTTLRQSFPNAEWRKPGRLGLTPGDRPRVKKCFLRFEKWTGEPIPEELRKLYGNKAVVGYQGHAAFAELAILQMLRNAKFDGRWLDGYHGKFWQKPWATLELPVPVRDVYDQIVRANGNEGGFWDVMAWNGGRYIFAESKHVTKGYRDQLQPNQKKWLKAALSLEEIASCSCFVICEWDFQ